MTRPIVRLLLLPLLLLSLTGAGFVIPGVQLQGLTPGQAISVDADGNLVSLPLLPGPEGPAGPPGPQGPVGPQGPAGSGATVACGTSDDTAAIQAAINASDSVQLPVGICRVTQLNLTGRTGFRLQGAGYGTRIVPISLVHAVIDLTSSSHITLRDFWLNGLATPGVVQEVGILNAQAAGSYASDVTLLENVRVDGYFTIAAWYNLAVASSNVTHSIFYNFQPSGITAILTGNNFFGAQSAFVTIDNSNTNVPMDWTILGSEFHNFGNQAAFWIGGAASIRVYGGNMSSQFYVVDLNAVPIASGTAYPAFLIFDGTTFYSDNGIQPACAIRGYSASYVSLRANQASMPLTGC